MLPPVTEDNQPIPQKNQATPVELAALFMDAACRPSAAEESALSQLAEFLDIDLSGMLAELMFLRAFSVDFAIQITLSEGGPEKEAILTHYYQHWEMVGKEADVDIEADLRERLQYYLEATQSPEGAGSGLTEQVGLAFATRLVGDGGGSDGLDDLAMLGGSMFAALFDELTRLLEEVEIVTLEP